MEKLINDFSFGLFFWQIAILVVLILLLKKFAWGPILNSLNSREEGIKDALESAEKARVEMQNLKADNEKLLIDARMERDAILKEARNLKEKMIAEASDEAQKKADKIVAQAKDSIEHEKQSAMNELKNQVANLSIEIAEKVVRKELSDKKEQYQMIERMIGDAKLN
ncbi:ATP synthase F0 subunit B [Christiangramia fulva]|uniref:ATP synthase subunit b n=1 Tax=Christiangramia fulva TaxID=2126553 RepID=A0A2R3Z3Q9_9FLAO|nr:F0F1 ATP synthase subunit B [Christiangramia fulva]AVR44868.1 ATP synthase F0 subunit B [Christiangramia fulva]